jgi:hypothetical protein
VRGNAKLGIDYTLSGTPGQVTIPAGQSLATVTLQALLDNKREKTEKAALVLQRGSGFRLANPKKATVSITNR